MSKRIVLAILMMVTIALSATGCKANRVEQVFVQGTTTPTETAAPSSNSFIEPTLPDVPEPDWSLPEGEYPAEVPFGIYDYQIKVWTDYYRALDIWQQHQAVTALEAEGIYAERWENHTELTVDLWLYTESTERLEGYFRMLIVYEGETREWYGRWYQPDSTSTQTILCTADDDSPTSGRFTVTVDDKNMDMTVQVESGEVLRVLLDGKNIVLNRLSAQRDSFIGSQMFTWNRK